jgi:hypothetical protein
MRHLKTPILAKFAVLATALALQGAAMAAAPEAPASATPGGTTQSAASAGANQAAPAVPHAKKHHHEKKGMSLWIPGYGPVRHKLVSSLNLNDSQMKLVADAQAAQQALRQSRRDAMKTARQQRKEQLDAGKVDPHAAVQAADAMWQKAMSTGRQEVNQKWLAVWDALDSTQQQKIAAYLKERADKPAGHDRHERHHY